MPQDDSPAGYRTTIISLKRNIHRIYEWSLNDIDETDISNLLAFIRFKPGDDPNTRMINGKMYQRASKPPSWL